MANISDTPIAGPKITGAGQQLNPTASQDFTQDTLAQGNPGLDASTQKLIAGQTTQSTADDTGQLMQGVAGAGTGLLKPQQNSDMASALGMSTPGDFYEALNQRSANAMGDEASNIMTMTKANLPLRQAKIQSMAAGNYAKNTQLEYNNWMLKNKQVLSAMQIQQAQAAAQTNFLGSILGVIGTGLGFGIGMIAGGPAGAAAGAAVGGSVGKAV